MGDVTIKIYGEEKKWPEGTIYADIAGEYKDRLKGEAALVLENNSIRELTRELKEGAEVSFIDMSRSSGHKAYVRTAILLMVKAIDDVCDHDKSKQLRSIRLLSMK